MAKSIRSKIKKYWRRELRGTIGKADHEKKAAVVQGELQKALDVQQGNSFASLKAAIGSTKPAMVTPSVDDSMVIDGEGAAEVALLNTTNDTKFNNRKEAALAKKKKTGGKASATVGKKKFVHFHTLRKKGA
ncbi:Aste57867_12429 [Aphanomyces stellatus]|uniref:Aste57867_12429 protein n=1 Tax=Aphanomyces stellatus TaxID=120398 RepID=A0A485KVX7_9STRA|nr:hypothetical protein As57867_012383 [Aphanomyces stellatus]VFT89280.1 Aste57867_12429 [Aphanomyces stellatus]